MVQDLDAHQKLDAAKKAKMALEEGEVTPLQGDAKPEYWGEAGQVPLQDVTAEQADWLVRKANSRTGTRGRVQVTGNPEEGFTLQFGAMQGVDSSLDQVQAQLTNGTLQDAIDQYQPEVDALDAQFGRGAQQGTDIAPPPEVTKVIAGMKLHDALQAQMDGGQLTPADTPEGKTVPLGLTEAEAQVIEAVLQRKTVDHGPGQVAIFSSDEVYLERLAAGVSGPDGEEYVLHYTDPGTGISGEKMMTDLVAEPIIKKNYRAFAESQDIALDQPHDFTEMPMFAEHPVVARVLNKAHEMCQVERVVTPTAPEPSPQDAKPNIEAAASSPSPRPLPLLAQDVIPEIDLSPFRDQTVVHGRGDPREVHEELDAKQRGIKGDQPHR